MTSEEQQNLLKSIGLFVRSQLEPLQKRIEALEVGHKEFRYVGVWAYGKYHPGNFVTHDGSLWHCNQDTERQPGKDGQAWTLCCKRGKDGKDVRAAA